MVRAELHAELQELAASAIGRCEKKTSPPSQKMVVGVGRWEVLGQNPSGGDFLVANSHRKNTKASKSGKKPCFGNLKPLPLKTCLLNHSKLCNWENWEKSTFLVERGSSVTKYS